jgi:hypothetical protein
MFLFACFTEHFLFPHIDTNTQRETGRKAQLANIAAAKVSSQNEKMLNLQTV